MYDVIVIGARCAGSALALLLARAGHKVLMVDRTTFPSDTMSSHYIHPAGVACLRRWGLIGKLAATDTPAETTMTIDFGDLELTAQPTPDADGWNVGYCPRRWILDPMLAEAAIEAGAELWSGFTVSRPVVHDGVVVGVEGAARTGQTARPRARIVVGADGRRSPFAESLGAAKYRVKPASTCNFYSYWSDFDADHTRLFVRDGRFCVVSPTGGGLTLIGVAWPIARFGDVRRDLEGEFAKALSEFSWISDRLSGARRAERFIGTGDLEGFYRTAHGPGWALVGDAGYHRDPITAQGITNAFQHAELLAKAIRDGLSGHMTMKLALAAYQQKRDEATAPMFELTHDMARLAPPNPEMATLLRALVHNQRETERFFGVIAGTVAVQDFFSAENLERICGQRIPVQQAA